MWFFLSLSLAQAAETCADPFATGGTWELAGQALRLDRGVLAHGDIVLAEQVLELDVVGEHAVFTLRNGPRRDLAVYDGTRMRVLLADRSPAQPKLSDDGRQVAFVDGVTSITAVYVVPFVGGEARQLTNVGLVRTPGRAPLGFVESPSAGLHFRGELLEWEGESATHSVRWTGGEK